MISTKIGKFKVELYDSISELPIRRFYLFNKLALIDAGIGSNLVDIDAHFSKIYSFIDADPDKAKQELKNLRQQLFLVQEKLNVEHLAFAPMIKSINDENISVYTIEDAKNILARFGEVKTSVLDKILEKFKKKVNAELSLYFPKLFSDPRLKEMLDQVKAKMLLQLDEIIEKKDNSSKINKIDSFLLSLAKPKIFEGKNSVEIAYEKQFETMVLYLSKETASDAAGMTTIQFYNAFEFIKNKK